MLYLDQVRNRLIFMALSIITTVAILVATFHGLNAVGIILATAVINILVYYTLPDSYSETTMEKYPNRFVSYKGRQTGI